jgi:hypothetical protein
MNVLATDTFHFKNMQTDANILITRPFKPSNQSRSYSDPPADHCFPLSASELTGIKLRTTNVIERVTDAEGRGLRAGEGQPAKCTFLPQVFIAL